MENKTQIGKIDDIFGPINERVSHVTSHAWDEAGTGAVQGCFVRQAKADGSGPGRRRVCVCVDVGRGVLSYQSGLPHTCVFIAFDSVDLCSTFP